MSFLSSNFNLCVLELPKEFKLKPAEIYDKLGTKRFKEITALEKSCNGWVAIHNMFKSNFTYEETCAGSSIVAAFRQDVKKVSGKLVRKLYLERLAERKKDGIKLLKDDKKILKEACQEELVLKALPTPNAFHFIIDMDKNLIYLDAKSLNVVDAFSNLFEATFSMRPFLKDMDVKDYDKFLDWLWNSIASLEEIGVYSNIVIKDDNNSFSLNSESLQKYAEQINTLKEGKAIKKLGLSMHKDVDYNVMINDKNFILSIKTLPKIKHESVETAVIDNVGRIDYVTTKIQDIIKKFSKKKN